jgi:hypothetical protein
VSYGWRREDGIIAEVCDECGFDSRRVRDLAGALRSVLTAIGELLGDPEAGRTPAPGTWSGAEYGAHALHVVAECVAEVCEAAGLKAVPDPADAAAAIAAVDAVDAVLGELVDPLLDEITVEAPFATLSIRDNLLHGLHDAEHHVLDIRRGYAGFALARGDNLHTTQR